MLVLSRQRDETIMIGDDVEVTVVDIRGDNVRLGINAPKELSVHRKEVWLAIKKQTKAELSAYLKGGEAQTDAGIPANPDPADPQSQYPGEYE